MYLKMNNMKEKTGEKSVFNVKYMWWITEHIVKIENTEVRNAALVALGASWESRTVGRSSIFCPCKFYVFVINQLPVKKVPEWIINIIWPTIILFQDFDFFASYML